MEDLIIFKAGKDIFCDDYCIMYNHRETSYIYNTKIIASNLRIPKKDFITDLKKFNAYLSHLYGNDYYFFKNKSDAENCAEFLNEKYGVIKKLTGELK